MLPGRGEELGVAAGEADVGDGAVVAADADRHLNLRSPEGMGKRGGGGADILGLPGDGVADEAVVALRLQVGEGVAELRAHNVPLRVEVLAKSDAGWKEGRGRGGRTAMSPLGGPVRLRWGWKGTPIFSWRGQAEASGKSASCAAQQPVSFYGIWEEATTEAADFARLGVIRLPFGRRPVLCRGGGCQEGKENDGEACVVTDALIDGDFDEDPSVTTCHSRLEIGRHLSR